MFCIKCGYNLSHVIRYKEQLDEPYQRQTPEGDSYTPSSFSSNRYAALRGIAGFCNGLANVVAVIAGLGALIIFFSSISDDALTAFGGLIGFAFIGGLTYVMLRVIAEGISVLLDIEANTKQSAVTNQQIAGLIEKALADKKTD